MRLLAGCLAFIILMAGCGGGGEKAAVNNAATPEPTKEAHVTETETPPPSATPSPATTTGGERPVDFTYLGLTSDKQSIAYKIKVNTMKPISQVDLGAKFTDAAGKVLEETTIVWQNIVKSKRQPIEKGKTYETDGYLPEGATKAEVTLKRVHFEDGTRWDATQP